MNVLRLKDDWHPLHMVVREQTLVWNSHSQEYRT